MVYNIYRNLIKKKHNCAQDEPILTIFKIIQKISMHYDSRYLSLY